MFAWECTHIEPGSTEPEICSIAGTKPTAYLEHMKREHGATRLHPTVAPIRLRKGIAGRRATGSAGGTVQAHRVGRASLRGMAAGHGQRASAGHAAPGPVLG